MRMISRAVAAAVLGTATLAISPAQPRAEVITFALSGVTFDDGGTASGSIVYDTRSGEATFNVSTTQGSILDPQVYAGSYTVVNGADSGSFDSTFPVCDGCDTPGDLDFNVYHILALSPFHNRILDMNISDTAPLDAPVPIDIGWYSREDDCVGQGCSTRFGERRITGGDLLVTDIVPDLPEPRSVLLLAVGLAATAAAAQRSIRSAR